MPDREKLVALIMDAARYAGTFSRYWAGVIAERLLANGVVVLKRGRWIEKDDGVMHCSECDRIGNPHIDHYCPRCGAKMDE